eukprot:TRINITY_DN12434_c0_g1_i6.p1 TRINITY_DN12434_c0_g1~~TRINITY_DN12434_c0_g1_i6.p1  ORF type:complete len:1128 (-),score=179.92 TRINITY_DN12434_c0_g1_i6:307-3690(-)
MLGRNIDAELCLKERWTGFDLMQVGTKKPVSYGRGGLVIISGCATTVSPMKDKAGWEVKIAEVDPRLAPPVNISFLSPTMMSRYEGIYQGGTSTTFKSTGSIEIFFNKNNNPMVIHLSGLCFLSSSEELIELSLISKPAKGKKDESYVEESGQVLDPDPQRPPGIKCFGNIVFLEGEFRGTSFGLLAQRIGSLPKGYRPVRELRFLACLVREPTEKDDDPERRVLEHSVALTLRPDGTISVQGGRVHMTNAKGQVQVLQGQKKRGRLCLDGLRFSTVEGTPIETSPLLSGAQTKIPAEKTKLSYLITSGAASEHSAVCIKQDDAVVLEGYVSWATAKPPNTKQPLATLPPGHWPVRRETFFTRGGSDMEERRRVDVDMFGRIFCPEGAPDGRVELTGIIFVTDSRTDRAPKDPEWDDLKLQYMRNDVHVVGTSFDGHALLEQFIRRSSCHDWRFMEYDFNRHALRKTLMPKGAVCVAGDPRHDPMNVGFRCNTLWNKYRAALDDHFKIETFNVLLHISDAMFEQVARTVGFEDEHRRRLENLRRQARVSWCLQRQTGQSLHYMDRLAADVVDEMFDHWDFRAQLQGGLENDFRAPQSIAHLFPSTRGGKDRLIKKNIKECDMAKFEEIRQFFHLYETTGRTMTHCSLMGSADTFSSTGKWHFPDSPHVQRQLFENIAWLFPRNMFMYMSERQTSRFPFIEDLDIQCRKDWMEWGENETPFPPDDLVMKKPNRDQNGRVEGQPGELMNRRAMAIHMVYPGIDELEAYVYSASGYNKGKDLLKSSWHLVWPQLIVDADRAPVIRLVTLSLFGKETAKPGSWLQTLQRRFVDLHESNVWELVFDNTTINARNGLRLPYSDKASMVIADPADKAKVKAGTLSKSKAPKKRMLEGRPSKAVGVIKFVFEKDPETGTDRLASSEWIKDVDSHKIEDWIAFGSCRRDPSNFPELTPWSMEHAISVLETKPGEKFEWMADDNGTGGQWKTHKPFENIRRCEPILRVEEFIKVFEKAIQEERDALKEEDGADGRDEQILGSWISATTTIAVWRTVSAVQMGAKFPDRIWGTSRSKATRSPIEGPPRRPTDVTYIGKKGKVVVDGPEETVETILRAIKHMTKVDDNSILPIYDVSKL